MTTIITLFAWFDTIKGIILFGKIYVVYMPKGEYLEW